MQLYGIFTFLNLYKSEFLEILFTNFREFGQGMREGFGVWGVQIGRAPYLEQSVDLFGRSGTASSLSLDSNSV